MKKFNLNKNFTTELLWSTVTQDGYISNSEVNLLKLTKNYSDADVLWRYMDLSKFLFLLETSNLFLTRLDKFEDKYEGEYPIEDFLNQAHLLLGKLSTTIMSTSENHFSDALDVANKLGFYANCWHLSENESYGMWKTYLASGEGVSIKTTVKKLQESMQSNNNEAIDFGRVEYIDYEKDSIIELYNNNRSKGVFTPPLPGLFKRKAFEYEKEFRIIATRIATIKDEKNIINELIELKATAKDHILLDINLSTLIETVYVSPFCGEWYVALIKSILKRYNLDIPVVQSALNSKPDYKV